MDESNKSKMTVFAVILLVIAIIHLIVLAIIIPNKNTQNNDNVVEKQLNNKSRTLFFSWNFFSNFFIIRNNRIFGDFTLII